MATTNMNLTLPTVDVTIGPLWANYLNADLNLIDLHDHTNGKGKRVPVAGLNINANVPMNGFSLVNISYVEYVNRADDPTDLASLFVKNGDLFFIDAVGNLIRFTAAGQINVSSVGGIGGDYPGSTASVFYEDSTL